MATKKTTQKKIVDLFLTLSKSQQVQILTDLRDLNFIQEFMDDDKENKNKDFDELFGDIE